MQMAEYATNSLNAPSRLVTETRLEFRRAALEYLERQVAAGARRIYVDLSATTDIDASGLGVLVLVQKRAREKMLSTCLLHANGDVQRMLRLTKLDTLFENPS